MRPIELDFVRRARHWPVWGIVLLIVGAGVLTQAVVTERALAGRIALSESKLALLTRHGAGHGVNSGDAQNVEQEIRQANDILQQLTLPWSALFKAVEGANDKEIALLAIQPDAQKSQVRLQGEAKNFKALLDYIGRLEQSGTLTQVYLTNHEVKAQDPDKPVQFSLVANWKMKP
jgi:Tfp pilus assembly protein PilN